VFEFTLLIKGYAFGCMHTLSICVKVNFEIYKLLLYPGFAVCVTLVGFCMFFLKVGGPLVRYFGVGFLSRNAKP